MAKKDRAIRVMFDASEYERVAEQFWRARKTASAWCRDLILREVSRLEAEGPGTAGGPGTGKKGRNA